MDGAGFWKMKSEGRFVLIDTGMFPGEANSPRVVCLADTVKHSGSYTFHSLSYNLACSQCICLPLGGELLSKAFRESVHLTLHKCQ